MGQGGMSRPLEAVRMAAAKMRRSRMTWGEGGRRMRSLELKLSTNLLSGNWKALRKGHIKSRLKLPLLGRLRSRS